MTSPATPAPPAPAETHEVGETYLVPAVRATWPLTEKANGAARWIPIMGLMRSDHDVVKFPPPHWHAAPRFLDYGELWNDNAAYGFYRDTELSDYCLERACINRPIPDVAPDPAVTGPEAEHVNIPDLDDARHPQDSYYGIMAFTVRRHILPDQQCRPWLRQLTEQFRGQTLIEGRYCPHRRADL